MKNAFIALFFLAALFIGCAPESDTDSAETSDQITESEGSAIVPVVNRISPPLEDVNVPNKDFSVEASEGEQITFSNGTEIIVPAGALVDENGIEVTGKVDFAYREFHDVADVLLSGIPMTYDSAGQSNTFQTAGMMEIRASKDGKPVYIKEGKEIEVKLTSFVDEDGYNLYSLNEETGSWSFEDISTSSPADLKESEIEVDLSNLDLPEEPFKPQVLQPGETPFEFDVDFSDFPELEPYKDLVWQLAKVNEKGVVAPDEIEAVFGEIWSSASVEEHKRKKGLFYLTLKEGEKTAKLLVTPVVEEANYQKAMAIYETIKRQQELRKAKLIVEAQQRQSRAKRNARNQRIFKVSSFGIYNCDRIYSMPQRKMVIANIEVEDFEGDLDMVYLIMKKDKAVIPYSLSNNTSRINYSSATPTMLVSFLPDNQLAIFDSEDFDAQIPSGNYTFKLRRTGKKVRSAKDLKSVIGV